MRRALELAARAEGSVSPRPPVGAVIVSESGEIVGEGWTRAGAGRHAETAALDVAGPRAEGATVYVTLEPCVQSSVSRPCAQALIASKVRRVVAATRDPNPDVNGRGLRLLRRAGIDVRTGVLRSSARDLIEPFERWITTHRPFVTLKLAMTLDGKAAAPDGTSKWITGPESRTEAHGLRRRVDAVIVGGGTVEIDDPSLTFRLPDVEGTQPLRVVADSSGRTSPTARVFDGSAPVLIVTTTEVPAERVAEWERAGADVVRAGTREGGVDLEACLDELGRRGLCHVLCEGGPTLAGSFAAQGLVDRFVFFLAPKLIGGEAPGVLGTGAKTLADAWELEIERVRTVGPDIRVDARPRRLN